MTDVSLERRMALPYFQHRTARPSLVLSVRCNNLFNRHYQIVQGYPMPGINAMASVTFQW